MDESYQRLQPQFESYLWDNEDTATVKTTKEKFIGDLNNSIKEVFRFGNS